MKRYLTAMLAGSSVLALAPCAAPLAAAQTAESMGEIVVSARRRDERLQDVPLTVNAVSADTLRNLGIQRMEDIETIVPGLSVAPDPVATSASMRGVQFNTRSSGNNATVEAYLNDAPTTAPAVFQSIFDIGQIEVLRGPQGTLRGRASPSGAITVTTRLPDLFDIGGYVEATANDLNGMNTSAALNLPIVREHLAVRVSGLFDQDEGDGIRSMNASQDPFSRTNAGRVSVLFQPTDSLTFALRHQTLLTRYRTFMQAESAGLADPNFMPTPGWAYATNIPLTADDRVSLMNIGETARSEHNITNWQAAYAFAGQRLSYVGSRTILDTIYNGTGDGAGDRGDFFGPSFTDPQVTGYTQVTAAEQTSESHELRLSSDTRLLDMFDYVVGYYYAWTSPDTVLNRPTLLFPANPPTPAQNATWSNRQTLRFAESEETSLFASVNWHIDDATELSAGGRYISYQNLGKIGPATVDDFRFHHTIYSLSLKHNFTDDFMAYASIGSSWRPGVSVIGNQNTQKSALETAHLQLLPETSESVEVGIKSDWLDGRFRLNVAGFRQEFDNYPYRGGPTYYVSDNGATESALAFNFVSAVPVVVEGVEIESAFQVNERWNINAVVAYANGNIESGGIACNDLEDNGDGTFGNGVPDVFSSAPTVGQIEAATGGDSGAGGTNIQECSVTQSSSFSPDWSASVQSEYSIPLTSIFDGYLRGQLQWSGHNVNDPVNPFDDVDSYSILNLYAGIRDPEGAWDLTFYVKNATDTDEVVARDASPFTVLYRAGTTTTTATSNYRRVSVTPEQEFGMTLRYAFGSR